MIEGEKILTFASASVLRVVLSLVHKTVSVCLLIVTLGGCTGREKCKVELADYLIHNLTVDDVSKVLAEPHCCCIHTKSDPQWGAADAEIKVLSGENTELKRSPFKALSMSVYSLSLIHI